MKHVTKSILILLCIYFSAHADFLEYNNHYYSYTTNSGTWLDAEAEATMMGGHLVSINDSLEQAFIETNFLVGSFEHLPLWIGITDEDHEGIWNHWVTGEAVTYTHWRPGEPNNYNGIEDYGAINWHYARDENYKGFWNDSPVAGLYWNDPDTEPPYFGIIELSQNPNSDIEIDAIEFHVTVFEDRFNVVFLNVSNVGYSPLSYHLDGQTSWLTFSSDLDTLSSNESYSVPLLVIGRSIGHASTTIQLISTDPDESITEISIELSVIERPAYLQYDVNMDQAVTIEDIQEIIDFWMTSRQENSR